MFDNSFSYHKGSKGKYAAEYIKFVIPSLPLSTMKELVKNTVRYVSFDEPLLERVVQAVLLGRKCKKSFAYNAPGLRDAVYLYIKYTTGGNLRFSMSKSLYSTNPTPRLFANDAVRLQLEHGLVQLRRTEKGGAWAICGLLHWLFGASPFLDPGERTP